MYRRSPYDKWNKELLRLAFISIGHRTYFRMVDIENQVHTCVNVPISEELWNPRAPRPKP